MKNKNKNIESVSRQLASFFHKKEVVHSESDLDFLWKEIETRATKEKQLPRPRLMLYLISAVASILLIVGLFNLKLFNIESRTTDIYASVPLTDVDSISEILLLTSENRKIDIESESVLEYKEDGTVVLSSGEVLKLDANADNAVDQLIVPRGKKVQIVLPDRSKIWVNSASNLLFPRKFSEGQRKVFLEGEAYLEISHNEEIPFVVQTPKFEVQVLGTSFNISAYKDEAIERSVVLLEGSVRIENENSNSILKPNQKATVGKDNSITIAAVDAKDYISWTDNYLVFRSQSLENVMQKLALYYNCKFEIEEEAKHLPISGKLDLNNGLEKTINTLSKTAPITYSIADGMVSIKKE